MSNMRIPGWCAHGTDWIETVQEFWHSEIGTTTRYRDALRMAGRCPEL